jgi:hypothetical protein
MLRNSISLDNDLSGLSVADVVERLEAGRCGCAAVMDYLGIDSLNELVATMHFNGRLMPGHRPMTVTAETLELIGQVCRRAPADLPRRKVLAAGVKAAPPLRDAPKSKRAKDIR